jgi:hypothetical protein
VSQRVCGYLAVGMHDEAACKLAGISSSTFYRWRAAGQEAAVARADAIEAGRAVPKESALVTAQRGFWEATERAFGQQEAGYLQVIAAAATGGATFTEVRQEVEHVRLPGGRVEARVVRETRNEHTLRPTWQAAAWILERRHPERWALRGRLELSGPRGVAIEHQVNVGRATVEDPQVAAAVDKLLEDAIGHSETSDDAP